MLVRGDITEHAVDAVVNAANSRCSAAAGWTARSTGRRPGDPRGAACCRHPVPRRAAHGPGRWPPRGRLPARWVIHTVGPVYAAAEAASDLLATCHRESLRAADELGAPSVAFPAISTGAYGYPAEVAAPVAVGTVRTAPNVEEVRFVLFGEEAHQAFAAAL